MKLVVQRVARAAVRVEGEVSGEIGRGLLVLVCGEPGDGAEAAAYLAGKVARMRLFEDAGGKMNLSVRDVGGSVLVVSQFTLAADWRRGNRPSFSAAAGPEEGRRIYELFRDSLRAEGVPVATGRFAAKMAVDLVNDGPVTVWMDHPPTTGSAAAG